MNILITGQCTLHWGRMEFGNIGNYYIMEPFLRELHKTFPDANIKTTFQMSERFCKQEKLEVLPMDLYYGWNEKDLTNAEEELELSKHFKKTGELKGTTPYIDAVLASDLIIDFSGDIWGDNADFLGANRFKVGMLKDLTAKNLGKKVVMLAGSPGPFSNAETKELALEVYKSFDLVTNREPISTELLDKEGFDTSSTYSLACPAFLFEPAKGEAINELLKREGLSLEAREQPIVGFILCGWNFESGPFDKWPRDDSEYIKFAENIEYLTETLGARVCLMSHSNGFNVPPAPFELIRGRDYPVIKQLQEVLEKRGIAKNVFALDGIYDTWETKAIVGSFDMLVSGRVHAAVAGLSQNVPTVIIDYGHEPKAHKLVGFATVAGAQEYVADPSNGDDLKNKIELCWNNLAQYKEFLHSKIPEVKLTAKQNFSKLKDLF